jgi:DnaK suppressor protein
LTSGFRVRRIGIEGEYPTRRIVVIPVFGPGDSARQGGRDLRTVSRRNERCPAMATVLLPDSRYERELQIERSSVAARNRDLERQARAAVENRDVSDILDAEHARPAIDDVDSEVMTILSRRAEQRIRDIDAALARLGDGRYGHCERCDARIPAARLIAVPETRYCLPCKLTGEGSVPR